MGGRSKRRSEKLSKVSSFKTDVFEASGAEEEDDVVNSTSFPDSTQNFRDEEIDEDAAFDEDDWERFGEHFASKKKPHVSEIDRFEEMEEGGMDLSEMLDDPKVPKVNSEEGKSMKFEKSVNSEKSVNFDENSDSESEIDEKVHGNLLRFIGKLDVDAQEEAKKRRKQKLRGVDLHDSSSATGEIGMADLLGSLLPTEPEIKGIKNKLIELAKDKTAKTLSTPLERVEKEKLDREVGFTKVTEDLSKWSSVVAKNRRAETLSFPLRENQILTENNSTLISKFKASTNVEKDLYELRNLLLKNNGKEVKPPKSEQQLQKEAEEEMEKQRKIAQMRSMLFHYQQKCARIKKIKSKGYRKRHRITSQGEDEVKLDELIAADGAAGKEELLSQERERAEARMNLRLKNSTKWLKKTMRFTSNKDGDLVESLKEQQRAQEKLRQRMEGVKKNRDDIESGESDDISDQESEIRRIEADLDAPMQDKGLMGMAFMKKANEKRRKEAQMLLDQLNDESQDLEDDGLEETKNGNGQASKVVITGRREFDLSSNSSLGKKPASAEIADLNQQQVAQVAVSAGFSTKSNAHLLVGPTDSSTDFTISPVSESTGETASKLGVDPLKGHDRSASTMPSDDKTGDLNPWTSAESNSEKHLELNESSKLINLASVLTVKKASSNETSEFSLLGDGSAQQAEMVKEAFEYTNLEQEDLEKEKDKIVASQMEKEESDLNLPMKLPGWGSWSGPGISSPKKRKPTSQELSSRESSRQKKKAALDKGMKHVLINSENKRDHKIRKLMLNQVPHPFQTREQYERSLSMPIGPEWNAQSAHAGLTKPAVVTKAGSIIEPMTWAAARHSAMVSGYELPKEQEVAITNAKAHRKHKSRSAIVKS